MVAGWNYAPFRLKEFSLWVPRTFFRSLGVACSLYIDDHLNGELFFYFRKVFVAPLSQRTPAYSYQSAEVALYIICTVLVNLGYFLDNSKCVLAPVTQTQHVGMIVEFIAQAFRKPEEKIKIAPLREQILLRQSTMYLKSLQRLMGKCISFSLAFPAGKFGGNSKDFQRWRGGFVPGFARRDCVIRWRSERHVAISFTSSA